MNKRPSSSKLFFYDLHDDGAKVQVMADARYLTELFLFSFSAAMILVASRMMFSFDMSSSLLVFYTILFMLYSLTVVI